MGQSLPPVHSLPYILAVVHAQKNTDSSEVEGWTAGVVGKMGRMQSCSKGGLNRGAWMKMEDKILKDYVGAHGEGKWSTVPKKAGLNRCGKSCRLRWLNYLRPNIKRGNISEDEEELIIKMHRLLGNRWSLIAGRLPGRTDNEIKNYWNTNAGKKALGRHPASSPGSSCLASSSIPCADQVAKPVVDAQAGEDAIENQGYEERLDEVIHPDVSIPPPPESNVGKDSCPRDLGLLDDHFLSKLLGMDEDAEKDDGGTGGVGWAGVEEKISGASSSMNTEEALMSPEFMILCESDLLSIALFLEDDGDLE